MSPFARRAGVLVGTLLVVCLVLGGSYAALAPLPTGPRELTYVVPRGTTARLASGAPPNVLPATIRLTIGLLDVLVLRNEDDGFHQAGPVLLGPQQTYRIPFRSAGRYQYACSLHVSGRLDIVVEPTPSLGWVRLLWRLARVTERVHLASAADAIYFLSTFLRRNEPK